jgi:predicted branched-subunit amino acid permease
LGLATLPYFGWALGTILGAIASNILPAFISDALGIALYAMFVAIIIPPSMGKKGVLPTVLLSAGLSCTLFFIPIFSVIPNGFKIIICAVLSAGLMAFLMPVKEREDVR